MRDAILNFHKQFKYKPVVKNGADLPAKKKFIVVGMGGSRLPALIAKTWRPDLPLAIHNDYGLPALPENELRESLIILSSYSGNTEEVLEAYGAARAKKYPLAAISVGGKLLEWAKRDKAPYIALPDTGIQPRSAIGYSLRALLKFLGQRGALGELAKISGRLQPDKYEPAGKRLAQKLKNFVPVIYASARNYALAYNWKIKFNETGKVPAFCAILPELNHNEMTGFDINPATASLAKPFYFIFLKDKADGPKINKRMEILGRLYKDRGLPVEMVGVAGEGSFAKIFSSLTLADWAAYHTALLYGRDPEEVPMVEEFKKLISGS